MTAKQRDKKLAKLLLLYADGKAAFFREFGLPEAILAGHIKSMAHAIQGHIYQAYMDKGFAARIESGLSEVAGQMSTAAAVAEALNIPGSQTYLHLHARVQTLLAEVSDIHSRGCRGVKIFGRQDGYENYFVTRKVPVDAAIMAIEQTLDVVYEKGWNNRRRKTYHAAGLLYYLGYENYAGAIKDVHPFPEKLDRDHPIHKRYRARRGEARKYLSQEAKQALLRDAANEILTKYGMEL